MAASVGWAFFLAFVALTPLVIAIVPAQLGSIAQWRGFDNFDLPKAAAILVFSGISLTALCVSVIRGETELRWHPALWILVGLFGWAGVSTLLSANPGQSVWGAYYGNEGLVAVFGYWLVAFLAVQYVRSTVALRAVAVAAVASGSLVSSYGLVQFAGLDPMVWLGEISRVSSTFGNADLLGTYLVFPLALAAGLALTASPGWRAFVSWAAFGLIGSAIVATVTRGAWIGALVVITCTGLVGWGAKWQASSRKKLVVSTLIIAAVAAIAATIVLVRPRMAGSATTLSSTLVHLSNGRTVIWLTGLRGWLQHPITGWGPDSFERAFQSAMGADWFALVQGIQVAHNAHSFLVQTLVTLGIPGLVLTVWALLLTAIRSLAGLESSKAPNRMLSVALWGGLIGMIVALVFGVSMPGISVWLWLAVGLLLAQMSHPVPSLPKAVYVVGASVGVTLAVWAASWVVADVIVGRAMQMPPGPDQVAELERATQLNPLTPNYRWLVAEAMINHAIAEQQSGQSAPVVDELTLNAISAFDVAAQAGRGDPLVRTAYANVLVSYAARHPRSDAAERAVQVAAEAVSLAPNNPAALGALARAYQISGRRIQAEQTARLARKIAPAYSMQTLGSLGLETTATP